MKAKEYFLYVRNSYNVFHIVHLITDNVFAAMGMRIYQSFIPIEKMYFDEVKNSEKRKAVLDYNKENKINMCDSCEIFALEKECAVLVIKDNVFGNLLGVFKQYPDIKEHGNYVTINNKTFIKNKIDMFYVKILRLMF